MDEQNQVPSEESKKLVDDSLMNTPITSNVQQMINDPQDDPTGVDPKDQEFMENVMRLINDGTIDLFRAETLMNKAVYNGLSDEVKGKADTNAIPLLGELRNIKKLYESGSKGSFQIQNLINRVRLTKERLEEECGDVYII